MRRKRKGIRWMMAALAGLSLAAQVSVLAEVSPADELQEMLEKQFTETGEKSAAEQYLQLDALKVAIQERGFHVNVRLGLTPETLRLLDLQDEIPEDAYIEVGFQKEAEEKNWMTSVEAGIGEVSLLDFALIDESDETLLFYAPQFLEDAVGISLDNLEEQYLNSALRSMLDADIDEIFVSLLSLDGEFSALAENIENTGADQMLTEAVETLEESISVEKSADGSGYIQSVPTQNLEEFYRQLLEEYASDMENLSADVGTGSETEMQNFYDALYDCFGEELRICYYTEDGYVTRISFDFAFQEDVVYDADTEEEVDSVISEEAAGEAETAAPERTARETETAISEEPAGEGTEAASEKTFGEDEAYEAQTGTVICELMFDDPAKPLENYDLTMTVEQENEIAGVIRVRKQNMEEGTVSGTEMILSYEEEDGSVFSDITLCRQTFDTATGDFNVILGVDDPDSGEQELITLDSTFSDVAEGKGFTWTVDNLAITSEGESMGLTLTVDVDAGPDVNAVSPQTAQMLLELSEDGLEQLVSSFSENMTNWYYYAYVQWIDALSDTGEETETETGAEEVTIIGENSGPTEISFVGTSGAEDETEAASAPEDEVSILETEEKEILDAADAGQEAAEAGDGAEAETGGTVVTVADVTDISGLEDRLQTEAETQLEYDTEKLLSE